MDALGDRMKDYEKRETDRRFLPMLPICARIDGRCFRSFTRGMERPYDQRLSNAMIETTKFLVEETGALVGYTQSDEISLLWYTADPKSQVFFDGKAFKLTSVCASLATSAFTEYAREHWPEKVRPGTPAFDCRAFQVPTKEEAANVFLWREFDATKNAVSMAARAKFSHKSLNGMNSAQMQERLFQEAGINFNDYPAFFKRGTFILRRKRLRELDPAVLESIPQNHRPAGPIERQVVEAVEMPPFSKVANRADVLFDGVGSIHDKWRN